MAAAGYWEEDTCLFISQIIRPGNIIVEIGANFGAHTLPMAQKVGLHGKVFAVEPMEYAHARLLSNLSLNSGLKNIVTFNNYLSSGAVENVEVEITSHWTVSADNNDTSTMKFTAVTIDQLFGDLNQLDVIKIDVDGADLDVLHGAVKCLLRHSPIVYVEVSKALQKFGATPFELCSFL